MIKLYGYGPSSNSRKVRAVLVEKGLEFSRVNIDLSKKEHKNPEYLTIGAKKPRVFEDPSFRSSACFG
jgi:glutathione S-transferase